MSWKSLAARAPVRLLAARLRSLGDGVAAQREAYAHLVSRLAATTVGRAQGLASSLPYEEFRRRLPPRTYEGFLPHIERMKAGEPDVLWPGRCRHFAVSSGTTADRTKYLPITPDMLRHFRRSGLASLLLFAHRTGDTSVFEGRHLFLGGSTALVPLPESGGWAGDLSGIAALNLPGWAENLLYEPGREIAQIADWPSKIEAIASRTFERNIALLAGIPSWLLIIGEALFAEAARRGRRLDDLSELWPGLRCIVHGGVPIAPFADRLRSLVGATPLFHEVYPASEGFIAVQDAEPEAGLRLLVDSGLFFEFVPLDAYDDSTPEACAARALPLWEAEPHRDYVLLLTTPGGLSRYVLGDIVRFVSTDTPRLVYVGRTRLQLSAFGEHVLERELTNALAAALRKRTWRVGNFHVAPLFPDPKTDRVRGCHEWWIEPAQEPCPEGEAEVLAAALDAELKARNDDYAAKRDGGGLAPPEVRLVRPGVFKAWMQSAGKWGGQSKMPRCRGDRAIADALSSLAQTHGTSRKGDEGNKCANPIVAS